MAALAPPPYPSSAPHTSTAPSSTSTTNSATPSKKQENLAAGRRRLEEFKRRKAAEKGKKTPAVPAPVVVSDQPARNVFEGEPARSSVLPANAGPSVLTIKQINSNGRVSEGVLNSDVNAFATKSSLPPELALASVMQSEPMGAFPSVSEGLQAPGEVFREDPHLTAVPSGSDSNDGSSVRETNANVGEQHNFNSSITTLGKADGQLGSLSPQDSKITNKTGVVPIAPLGSSLPLFVPKPPLARKDNFGPTTGGHEKPETTKNTVMVQPSPFNKIPSSTQGFRNSFNPSGQKPNGGSLVMLDSTLVPSDNMRKGQLLSSVSEPDQEVTLPKSRLPPWVPPTEEVRTDNHTDGTLSAPALSAQSLKNISNSLNVKSYNGKGSEHPAAISTSISALPPTLGTTMYMKETESSSFLHPPVSEAKHLPLPPPLSRPPIPTSAFKPEPFVPPVFKNGSESNSSSSSTISALSSRPPSTSGILDNALLRGSAPSTFQFPGSLSVVNAIQENGKPGTAVNPLTAVLSNPSSSVGEILTQPTKAAEPVDESRQIWPSSAGGDDFAMLEQHIEDLTQEKFSLQRGLDSARSLAETLAQENSALTEDFNNQGALVNELKAETERQQGEIRAQAVVVKNMKVERDKAVQDCKAAVERSQALAAEVIALEEKVLRARSQELKLQRGMESLSAESESQKRHIISLDKDRANLKTLMEALQEERARPSFLSAEKGLLQTQIRKATTGGSAGDLKSSSSVLRPGLDAKADASTSTEDFELGVFLTPSQGSAGGPQFAPQNALGFGPLEQQRRLPLIIPSLPSRPLPSPSHHGGQASGSFSVLNEVGSTSLFSPASAGGNFSGRSLNLGPTSLVLPPDQAGTIGNINTLITELAEEKEALVKALRAESVGAGELRTLNAELSHKLEVQTQRLELAVAQSMAANDATPRVGSSYTVSRITPEYIDEGDEVVDRVLGWIMQLFPSGSSRRKRL